MLTVLAHIGELLFVGLVGVVLLLCAVAALLEGFRNDPHWWR